MVDRLTQPLAASQVDATKVCNTSRHLVVRGGSECVAIGQRLPIGVVAEFSSKQPFRIEPIKDPAISKRRHSPCVVICAKASALMQHPN